MSNRCKPDANMSRGGISFPTAAGMALLLLPPKVLQK